MRLPRTSRRHPPAVFSGSPPPGLCNNRSGVALRESDPTLRRLNRNLPKKRSSFAIGKFHFVVCVAKTSKGTRFCVTPRGLRTLVVRYYRSLSVFLCCKSNYQSHHATGQNDLQVVTALHVCNQEGQERADQQTEENTDRQRMKLPGKETYRDARDDSLDG